jgi:hypothetical protein
MTGIHPRHRGIGITPDTPSDSIPGRIRTAAAASG